MKKSLLLISAIFLFAGCEAVNPLIQNFNIISVPQEREIGNQAAQEIAQNMRIVTDPDVNNRVKKIGQRLAAAVPQKDFDYEYAVVDNATPNAFTIPGGKIYVHTGLLKFATSDDELAGVMAHETGHAIARHPAKNMSRAYGVERLSELIFKGSKKDFKTFMLQFAANGFLTHYSREDELQADAIGFDLMGRAGFNPDGLLSFFRKLQNLEGGGFSIPFLSDHPPTPERIARLQALERQRSGNIQTSVPQKQFYN